MDTASGTDGYRHTYGSHSLPPSSKLNVPKWASATTPSGRVAQRLGHIWVPHTYRHTMVEGRDVGGSCQGSAQLPDRQRQLHILKPKLRRKCEQNKRDWCYAIPSKTIPQTSLRYLRSRPSHTNPRISDPSWTYLSVCALRMEGSEPQ